MKDKTNMAARNVTFEKCAIQRIVIADSHVIYEPSVFGGDGSEPRKNIVLAISPEDEALVHQIESEIDQKKLNSCIKDGTIKAKITLDSVHVYDAIKNTIEHPQKWRGCLVNAIIVMRGKWSSKTQSGLSLELTDIQIMDTAVPPQCPF